MFISIPKEFFVEVIFDKKFTLNKENNNMELDTDNYRESNTDNKESIKTEVIYTELKDIESSCNKVNEEILDSIDDEFVDIVIEKNEECN